MIHKTALDFQLTLTVLTVNTFPFCTDIVGLTRVTDTEPDSKAAWLICKVLYLGKFYQNKRIIHLNERQYDEKCLGFQQTCLWIKYLVQGL